MMPKDKGSTAPDRQRPITCLNLCYKLLTTALTMILRKHVRLTGVMPP